MQALGRPATQIARDLGISVSTVHRYKKLDDEPEWEEARERMIAKFEERAWEDIFLLMDSVHEGAVNHDFKPKDAAVVAAIYIDKISILKKPVKREVTNEKFSFNLIIDGNRSTSIADSGSVPFIEGEVQGDDMRPGCGEDVLGLPRSGDDEP